MATPTSPKRKPSVLSVFGVITQRIGGTESYARELSAQLARHGWDSILCFENDAPEMVRQYLAAPNVTLVQLPEACALKWSATREMGALIRQLRPTLLHLHYVGFLGTYPWQARLGSVERVFFTDHRSPPEGHLIGRAAFARRLLSRLVNWPITRVFAVSQYGYRAITGLDVLPADRFAVHYNGVDLTRTVVDEGAAARFRTRFAIPEDRSIIAQICWMIPEKGVGDLLAAAALVVRRNPRAHFVLVGDGHALSSFQRQAAEMGLAGHLTWTGNLVDTLAEGVYAAAEIVCQMSRWEEVFGFVIAEAMASGKPVIATRVGGIPELIDDGQTGFLVDRGDHQAMADKILALLADADLRHSMGCAGRLKAEIRFDLKKNVAELLRSYGIG
jgi:glycosyltransferase involved in cell wall biosynthesis